MIKKIHAIIFSVFFLFFVFVHCSNSLGQSGSATEPDIEGTILKDEGFSNEMDINLDGSLDVTDLVYLLKTDIPSSWSGGLRVDRLSAGFEMEMSQEAPYQGVLKSDGKGGIPAGDWQVGLVITQNSFSAAIGPIQVENTLLGTFERTILLESTPDSDSGHIFDLDSLIVGRMSETLAPTSAAKSYLTRTIEGTFTLIREPAVVPVYEAELLDLDLIK